MVTLKPDPGPENASYWHRPTTKANNAAGKLNEKQKRVARKALQAPSLKKYSPVLVDSSTLTIALRILQEL
jgi:hypothetical protein